MSLEYHITRGNTELLSIANQHRDDIILLDFHAVWCGPCKAIAPQLHKLTEEYKDSTKRVVLCKVDVDTEGNEDVCEAYKVSAMPTLVWISNMNMMERLEGANSKRIAAITEELCT